MDNIGGWIVSVLLALIGTIKFFWEYKNKQSDNETKVKLTIDEKTQISRDELKAQNDVLIKKLDETEKKLDELLLVIEIVFPALQKLVEDNPTYKPILENAFKHFNKNK